MTTFKNDSPVPVFYMISILILMLVCVYLLNAYLNKPSESTAGFVKKVKTASKSVKGMDADLLPEQDASEPSKINYSSTQYGFRLNLPETWNGFKVVDDVWTGTLTDDDGRYKGDNTGPVVVLRHPNWAKNKERQDIPIMVFTHEQWEQVKPQTQGHLHLNVSAAPVGPTELAQNNKYVFALPARYNYAYKDGWEEVTDIIEKNAARNFFTFKSK